MEDEPLPDLDPEIQGLPGADPHEGYGLYDTQCFSHELTYMIFPDSDSSFVEQELLSFDPDIELAANAQFVIDDAPEDVPYGGSCGHSHDPALPFLTYVPRSNTPIFRRPFLFFIRV